MHERCAPEIVQAPNGAARHALGTTRIGFPHIDKRASGPSLFSILLVLQREPGPTSASSQAGEARSNNNNQDARSHAVGELLLASAVDGLCARRRRALRSLLSVPHLCRLLQAPAPSRPAAAPASAASASPFCVPPSQVRRRRVSPAPRTCCRAARTWSITSAPSPQRAHRPLRVPEALWRRRSRAPGAVRRSRCARDVRGERPPLPAPQLTGGVPPPSCTCSGPPGAAGRAGAGALQPWRLAAWRPLGARGSRQQQQRRALGGPRGPGQRQ